MKTPMLRPFAAAALLALAGATSMAIAADSEKAANNILPHEFELNITGKIDIGPDGLVRSHQLDDKVSSGVRSLVNKAIEQWRFEPVLIDGRPVIARTKLHLSIEAKPVTADSYQLTMQNVWFGESWLAEKMNSPRYPDDALRIGLGAKVLLVAKLGANGEVVDVYARQTSLSHPGREKVEQRWRRTFERASIAAAKKWRFKPNATASDKATNSVVMVPVQFDVGDRSSTKGWHAFVPGPINDSPWPEEDRRLADISGLKDGEAASIDSRFKLKTEIAGTVL